MVKHGSAVSRISQAQFNAILGVGNTVIPLTLLTNRINSNARNSLVVYSSSPKVSMKQRSSSSQTMVKLQGQTSWSSSTLGFDRGMTLNVTAISQVLWDSNYILLSGLTYFEKLSFSRILTLRRLTRTVEDRSYCKHM